MKKILGLTVAILLCMGMAATGTWAYSFGNSGTSSNNSMLAGTLDLVPSTDGTGPAGKYTPTPGGNGINGNVVFVKMLPGESGTVTWALVNNGSLSGNLVIASTDSFGENGSNEIEAFVSGNNDGGNGDLDQYLGVKLQRGVGTDQASAEAGFTYILGNAGSYVAASGLKATLNAQSISMAASGGNDTIVYKLSWDSGSLLSGVNGNIIQSDSAQIDITFTLNQ